MLAGPLDYGSDAHEGVGTPWSSGPVGVVLRWQVGRVLIAHLAGLAAFQGLVNIFSASFTRSVLVAIEALDEGVDF